MNKKGIDVIGCYYGKAGKVQGAELGALQLMHRLKKSQSHLEVIEIFPKSQSMVSGIECLDEVVEVCSRLKSEVSTSLLQSHKVFIIGGDHSIALGSIAGALKAASQKHVRMGVIYIDAHADMNTIESSITKNIHGMGMAALMNLGDERMRNVCDDYLQPQNVFLIGTRALDPFEAQLIHEKYIHCIASDFCNDNEDSIYDIREKINQFVNDNQLDCLHVSVDIDVVDPNEAPGTGVPEGNGIGGDYLKQLLEIIINSNNVQSVDFVEYNPCLDKDDKTYRLSQSLCEIILNTL